MLRLNFKQVASKKVWAQNNVTHLITELKIIAFLMGLTYVLLSLFSSVILASVSLIYPPYMTMACRMTRVCPWSCVTVRSTARSCASSAWGRPSCVRRGDCSHSTQASRSLTQTSYYTHYVLYRFCWQINRILLKWLNLSNILLYIVTLMLVTASDQRSKLSFWCNGNHAAM